MFAKIQDRIISYTYTISSSPILLRDLLRANSLYNENLYVDPALLNFHKNITKSYMCYFALCATILVPVILIWHFTFAKLDFHFSILGTIIATSAIFIGYDVYKLYMRKKLTYKLIRKAWEVHFPYFPYEKYSKKASQLYNEAIKKEIPRMELDGFVMQRMA